MIGIQPSVEGPCKKGFESYKFTPAKKHPENDGLDTEFPCMISGSKLATCCDEFGDQN